MDHEIDPRDPAVLLPMVLFNILAATKNVNIVGPDDEQNRCVRLKYISDQCIEAIQSVQALVAAEDMENFKEYCQSSGDSPFQLGLVNYRRFVAEYCNNIDTATVARPATQASTPGRAHQINRLKQQRIADERIAAEEAAAEAERLDRERERDRIVAEEAAAEAERLDRERDSIAAEEAAARKAETERRRQERIARDKAEALRR
eukprot:CAMPEP_0181068400 /NCGR_PEP_ID=MMETSP1070-20121207/26394_1 /TAXON_ID=265543 /ORGANISM="Minutocellus polymorphus, Strain NH13" /LENGTH=203 /DNA_ID=CAMNT_0023149139 /DNA_START=163 /DNA_END=771 /DNA_ORIENTATION=+